MIRDILSSIPKPCVDRPYICRGDPAKCDIIIVGENPATKVGEDWWKYVSEDGTFDLLMFDNDYGNERIRNGKRPKSNTRYRIDKIIEYGFNPLITNAHANERLGGNAGYSPNKIALDLIMLYSHLPIIAHGSVAHQFIDGCKEVRGRIYRIKHLRLVGYEQIKQLCDEIRNAANKSAQLTP